MLGAAQHGGDLGLWVWAEAVWSSSAQEEKPGEIQAFPHGHLPGLQVQISECWLGLVSLCRREEQ